MKRTAPRGAEIATSGDRSCASGARKRSSPGHLFGSRLRLPIRRPPDAATVHSRPHIVWWESET